MVFKLKGFGEVICVLSDRHCLCICTSITAHDRQVLSDFLT